jgi:hypothetical protein
MKEFINEEMSFCILMCKHIAHIIHNVVPSCIRHEYFNVAKILKIRIWGFLLYLMFFNQQSPRRKTIWLKILCSKMYPAHIFQCRFLELKGKSARIKYIEHFMYLRM